MHLYGLIIGIAIILGLNYFEKHNKVIPQNKLHFFEIGLIVFAIVGARAYHVIDEWQYYSQNPWLIPQTWNGGLGIYGGFIAAYIFIIFFVKKYKISVLKLLDQITPILPLCQAIGRVGNYVNQENPLWWPEAIGNLILFIFINRFPSSPTAKYLVGYGVIRFVTEFWRQDTWVVSHIKIAQVISIFFIFIGLILFYRDRPKISQKHS